MSKIYCKLFGIPQILKDGEKVFFPYAKINALIYYIIINTVVSRDEIAGLLWPDENEKTAKKNLRNALYQAKKHLDSDFIISPKKSILVLNEDIDIECDVNLFTEDPEKNLDLYEGDFLQGFFLKDSDEYEHWITKTRNFYQDKFTNVLYQKIEKDIENGIYNNIEKNINKLIQIDEFDERNFRLLMRYFQKTGRAGKVIETYQDLSKLLLNELGVEPDEKTKAIYEDSIKLINLKNATSRSKNEYFYGRYNEIALIEQTIDNFSKDIETKSIFLTGEAGIGKSFLKKKVLEHKEQDFFILESFSYQAEENHVLRPFGIIINKLSKILKDEKIEFPTFWNATISKLFPNFDDFSTDATLLETKDSPDALNLNLVTQIIVESIKKVSEVKKLIIIFEDIQWMDESSIKLLTSVMLHIKSEAMFILTSRNQYNKAVDDLIVALDRYHKVEKIQLSRFSFEESKEFIKKSLPEMEFDEETFEKIYSETEGNSFFLNEYVHLIKSKKDTNIMTSKMIDTIKSRFLYLSENEKKLLDIVSFFYDRAPLSVVSEIMGKNEIDLLPSIEELCKRNIISEVENNNSIYLTYTHIKLREYVYMTQSSAKKRITHKQIGDLMEAKLDKRKNDPYLLSKLVYHYNNAGEELKSLKYRIETLNYYLNFSHELFPILNLAETPSNNIVYISRDKIQNSLDELEDIFEKLKKDNQSDELKLLEIEFFYMKGRYLIRDGDYKEGVDDMKSVIQKAIELDEKDFVLDGYKQMIFYNIQTNNANDMIEYIELALDLAVKCNYHKEIGILLRLKGLYNMMTGNYFTAEKLLTESINTFNVTEDVANRYAINIAAAYNYIGELRFALGEYEDSITNFKKAIELTINKNALSSLSVFYINLGKSYFAMEDIDEALNYFNLAYELYGQFDSFWKRPVLESYMALIEVKKGNYKDSYEHISSAMKFSEKMEDPRAFGSVYFALYQISIFGESNKELQDIYKDILVEDSKTYKEKALSSLDMYRDLYEINIVNENKIILN
ncbi:BTAD domain-containing putative transcriptional regulator [Anaerosphaera multitolerans]|uniref:LuxR family transcriptional regulator n=1 Tax=Anaerosphaera multitolerans TaxID=2487351 RepID=A0A437S6S5_9FIRM|nr:tetratricopeptide repeat protein [Anaerosphaera multitolerans]RVU54729.1 LuxR family transcriptional regulator [Anaerosphaera multitolerans]